MIQMFTRLQLIPFLGPSGDLVDAAARIFVQRNVVALDQLRILGLDIEHIVFGVVLAGFGAVVAKAADIVHPNHIVVLFRAVLHGGFVLFQRTAANLGIQVVAVLILQLQQPAHMVDARDQLPTAFQLVFHAQLLQQAFGADLHTVAQAHGFNARIALHIAAEHSHGVGIVQEQRVRAYFPHVSGKIVHHGDGAQGAHDAADAQRIADGLAKAVLLGHFKVDNGAGIVQTHLNGVDHETGAAQGFLAVLHAQMLGDAGMAALGLVHGGDDFKALFQPGRVDVIQGVFPILQRVRAHAVAQHVAHEDRAASAHKGDLIHTVSSFGVPFGFFRIFVRTVIPIMPAKQEKSYCNL